MSTRPQETPADWMDEGACRGQNADLFFPERGEDLSRAKAICAGCEVRQVCLEHSLTHRENFGVWGGLSGKERLRLRMSRRRT